jgi:methionyl-tRNA synthetase
MGVSNFWCSPWVIGLIDFETFKKMDLRIATILEAEKVEGTKKLVKMQINLGDLGHRQIVASIAEDYPPQSLVGKQIAVIANLKPAVIRGIKSEGMLLAGETTKPGEPNYQIAILVPDKDLPPGTKIH